MEISLTGKWKGTIVYGNEYTMLKDKELYFEMELQLDGDKIFGTAKDTGGEGMNDTEATIKGIFINNRIDFIKRYEKIVLYEGNSRTHHEIESHPAIYYSGVFDFTENSFSGTWEYKPGTFKLKSGEAYRNDSAKGSWTMKKN